MHLLVKRLNKLDNNFSSTSSVANVAGSLSSFKDRRSAAYPAFRAAAEDVGFIDSAVKSKNLCQSHTICNVRPAQGCSTHLQGSTRL
jgi:hypothetical protein